MTGTMWHSWLSDTLRRLGVPFLSEVNLTPWMPKGWGGTADAFVWNPELKAFVLVDFKTIKGEGLRYVIRDGAKEEHIAQTSLYWHAAKKMGLQLAKAIGVFYLPVNDTRNKDEVIEPVLIDFAPLPSAPLSREANRRTARVGEYLASLAPHDVPFGMVSEHLQRQGDLDVWLTDALEPEQERTQRLYFDRSTETYDLKLVPHWSAAYCPFPDELCACNTHGSTKIGTYDVDGAYYPRSGYENIVPEVSPG